MAIRTIERVPLSKNVLAKLRTRMRQLKDRWRLGKLDINQAVGGVLDAYAKAYERDGQELSRDERTALKTTALNAVVRAGWISGVEAAEEPGKMLPIDSTEEVPIRIGRVKSRAAHGALIGVRELIISISRRYWREVDQRKDVVMASGSVRVDSAEDREALLEDFCSKLDKPLIAAIQRCAGVHKPDYYKWLHGKLPSSSEISMRLVKLLLGQVPFQDPQKNRRTGR